MVVPSEESFDYAAPDLASRAPLFGRSKRSGLLVYKIGLIGLWDEWGVQHVTTVCKAHNVYVVDRKTVERDGYDAVKLGIGGGDVETMPAANIGEFVSKDLPLKRTCKEFRVSSDCALPVGLRMSVRHFVPGQFVFVSSFTRHRGFQGVVKRWGFKGDSKTRGTTKGERKAGSISFGKGAGKVLKYKRMPGHMGGDPRTVNAQVFRTETARDLIFLTGTIPGEVGSILKVSDARGKASFRNRHIKLPYPTFAPIPGQAYPVTVQMPPTPKDPFALIERNIYDARRKK